MRGTVSDVGGNDTRTCVNEAGWGHCAREWCNSLGHTSDSRRIAALKETGLTRGHATARWHTLEFVGPWARQRSATAQPQQQQHPLLPKTLCEDAMRQSGKEIRP
jgi:hypothetical protein